MPCDEGSFSLALPLSQINESCENGVDDLGSEEGTCDWGGFSKQCAPPTTPDVNCKDVPLIGLIPATNAVLAPDATAASTREVKVECRARGVYPLAITAGVSHTSTSLYAPWLGPSQDPNQANDTTATVVTVTCSATPVGGIAEYPQTGPPSASAARRPSGPNTLALAGIGAAVGAALLAAGGWYARRRWRTD
jgi:hypothetical protein